MRVSTEEIEGLVRAECRAAAARDRRRYRSVFEVVDRETAAQQGLPMQFEFVHCVPALAYADGLLAAIQRRHRGVFEAGGNSWRLHAQRHIVEHWGHNSRFTYCSIRLLRADWALDRPTVNYDVEYRLVSTTHPHGQAVLAERDTPKRKRVKGGASPTAKLV